MEKDQDVKDYLVSLNNYDINYYLNDLCRAYDSDEKSGIIFDILHFLKLDPQSELYHWIEDSLKKMYKVDSN